MDRNSRTAVVRGFSFLLLVVLFCAGATPVFAEELRGRAQVLRSVEWQKDQDRASVTFSFSGEPAIDQPVIEKNRVTIYCRNTSSGLSSYQSGKTVKSWVRLKKTGSDLHLEIAVPPDFPNVRHAFVKDSKQLVVTFGKGATQPPAEAARKQPSSSGLLTLNFHESDIRQVLLGMAMSRNMNVVISPDVTGKITLHLENVPIEEAISTIVLAAGYHCRTEKGVYFIYKPKERVDSQSDRLAVKVFKLKFAKTDKVQEILGAIPGIRTVRIHDDTKSIIVEDTPENIAKIEAVIDAWDAPPKQVLIEAKILEVTLTDDMRLGVDWNKVMGSVAFTTFTGAAPQAAMGANAAVQSSTGNFATPALGGGLATVKTAVGTAHEFSVALAALQNVTRVNTLSTPKILAVHGKPARVQVGGKTGYSTTVSNLGVTTQQIQFIDTGTLLDITAFISDESSILLTVQPQLTNAVVLPTGIPDVSTTNVSTSLLAKSGQTIFIGGLIRQTVQKTEQKVPFLSRVPLIGLLFGYANPVVQKTELVVLITPYLFPEDIDRHTADAAQKVDKLKERYRDNPPTVYKEYLREGETR